MPTSDCSWGWSCVLTTNAIHFLHCCRWHSTCPHAFEQLLVGWDHRCSLSIMTGQGVDNTASTSTSSMMMGHRAGGTTQQWRGTTPTLCLWAPACRVDCGHLWQWNNEGDGMTTTMILANEPYNDWNDNMQHVSSFPYKFYFFYFFYSIVLNFTSFSSEKLDQLCWKWALWPQPMIHNIYHHLGHVSFFFFLFYSIILTIRLIDFLRKNSRNHPENGHPMPWVMKEGRNKRGGVGNRWQWEGMVLRGSYRAGMHPTPLLPAASHWWPPTTFPRAWQTSTCHMSMSN